MIPFETPSNPGNEEGFIDSTAQNETNPSDRHGGISSIVPYTLNTESEPTRPYKIEHHPEGHTSFLARDCLEATVYTAKHPLKVTRNALDKTETPLQIYPEGAIVAAMDFKPTIPAQLGLTALKGEIDHPPDVIMETVGLFVTSLNDFFEAIDRGELPDVDIIFTRSTNKRMARFRTRFGFAIVGYTDENLWMLSTIERRQMLREFLRSNKPTYRTYGTTENVRAALEHFKRTKMFSQ